MTTARRTAPAGAQRMGFATHQGPREMNEDSYLLRDFVLQRGPGGPLAVVAVADGMGGHSAGGHASRIAIEALEALASRAESGEDLRAAVTAANERILDHGRSVGSQIGTTLTVAAVEPGIARIAHVGDSRAYLVHRGQIMQVTDDHSLVGDLVRRGAITPEEASTHSQRNVLQRAVGADPVVDIDTYEAGMEPGDTLVLCSDGLHNVVTPEEIAVTIARTPSMQQAAADLVGLSLARGTEDNATVVIWRYPGEVLDSARQTVVGLAVSARADHALASREMRRVQALLIAAASLLGLGLGFAVKAFL